MTVAGSIFTARRFLFGRRARAGRRLRGGVVGVGLSLVPLIVVLQVADGMIEGITDRFIEAGSYHIQAVAREELTADELDSITGRLAGQAGVRLVAVERQGLGLAASEVERTGVTVRAVEPDLWQRDPGLRGYLRFSDGEWSMDDDESVLVGVHVADALGIGVGDELRILTARPLSAGRFIPRSTTFTVRGVFSTGYADLDRLWVFVPYARGSRILPVEATRTLIGLKVDAPRALPNPLFGAARIGRSEQASAAALLSAVRSELAGRFRVQSWFEAERPKFMSFKTTRDLLIFLMVLIVVVAAVNISSTLVMLVLEKQEEIAILKSMGASPAGIRRCFLMAGAVMGGIGLAVGMAVGLLLAVNINEVLQVLERLLNLGVGLAARLAMPFGGEPAVPLELLSSEYYLETIPIAIRLSDLVLVGALTVLLSTAAAWFPARRAAAILPLETLRRH